VGRPRIAPTRLRHGAETLFGRKDDLSLLDKAWDNPSTHILSIVAWGGVGKTSLVIEWMARRAAAGWPGFERVFDWSFYDQGTEERGAASADTFMAAALGLFGGEEGAKLANTPISRSDKASRLTEYIQRKRVLLVLDGMEPLQHSTGPSKGALKDEALATLLRGLAQFNPGLCLITSRLPVLDLAPFSQTTAPIRELHQLSTQAGLELLRVLGVKGTVTDLVSLVEEVQGHALTLDLLGRYLKRAHQGDVRQRARVGFQKADLEVQGGHAFRVMAAYDRWFLSGGERGQRQVALLFLMGLFDRPADDGCVAALREAGIPGLTDILHGIGDAEWNLLVDSLRECGLISTTECGGHLYSGNPQPTFIDVHPLVREYYARSLSASKPDACRAAHSCLFSYLESLVGLPADLADIEMLYRAVIHGCRAGRCIDSLEGVLRPRIHRGKDYFSIYQYGAVGLELRALAEFFDETGYRCSDLLTNEQKAFLFKQRAYCQRSIGRWRESKKDYLAALCLYEQCPNEPGIVGEKADVASHLSEIILYYQTDSREALKMGAKAVRYAKISCDYRRLTIAYAFLLEVLLHTRGPNMGKRLVDLAMKAAKLDPIDGPHLHMGNGYRYCEWLLDQDRWPEALEVLISNRIRDRRHRHWGLPSRGTRAFVTARLRRQRGQGRDLRKATALFRRAANLFRRAGRDDWLVLGLFELADSLSTPGSPEVAPEHADEALRVLREAWQIAEGCEMRLYQAMIFIRRVRLFGHMRPYPPGGSPEDDLAEAWNITKHGLLRLCSADIHLQKARLFHSRAELRMARSNIEECGYWLRKKELEAAEEAAKAW